MHRCIFKALANSRRIVCGLFIALAQIRRSKLRCTCHGAIFERVLVRRTQEYKSIPRTTSRKSPEIAHVRRHGSLSCMPLFSLRATLSFSRCVFAERKRIIIKKCAVLLWRKWIVIKNLRRCFGGSEFVIKKCAALFWRKRSIIKKICGVTSAEVKYY